MTGIPTFLIETSNQAVWLGLDVAAKATVVLLLALAVNRLLNGRVLARAAVWNALLVGLLLLPAATALFPRLRICCLPPTPTEATVEIPAESPLPAETAVPDEVLTAPDQDQNSLLSFLAAGFGEGHSLTDQRATAVEPEPVGPQAEPRVGVGDPSYIAPNPATSSPRWPGVILCTYLLGVVILAVRLTMSLLAVRALRRQSILLNDSEWSAALAAWRERLGIRQAVQLGVSSAVNVPIQIGWLKPMVILPAEMIGNLDPDRHGSILLHELAHVRRRDYAWQILLKLVQVIYWPHPLIWLAGRMIGANREQVCDDLCVHHSSSAGQYRATLLEVASALVRRPAASLGIAMARTSKIGGRLERIDRGCRLSRCLARWPVRLAIVAVVLAGACMIAPVELAHREAQNEASPDVPGAASTQPIESTVAPAGAVAPATNPAFKADVGATTTTGQTTTPGLLEFRIVPNRTGSTTRPVLGSDKYVEDLKKNGPLAGRQRGDEFQWFEHTGVDKHIEQAAVTGTYEGRQYILLCGRDTLSSASPHPAVMLPEVDGKRLWGIRRVAAAHDNMGRPALSFEFDDAGAEHMERLSSANIDNSLAFLVNGKVISTARIMSTIRDKGQITGSFTAAEVDHLAASLRAEMMPSSQPGGDGDAKDSIASQPAGGSLEGRSGDLPDRARRVRPQ